MNNYEVPQQTDYDYEQDYDYGYRQRVPCAKRRDTRTIQFLLIIVLVILLDCFGAENLLDIERSRLGKNRIFG